MCTILLSLNTENLSKLKQNIVSTFADGTVILAINDNNIKSIKKIQTTIAKIQSCTDKWRIRFTESESGHIICTNKRVEHKSVYLNDQVVPHENAVKYLDMTIDAKLRWMFHVKKKQEELKPSAVRCIGGY